MARGALGSFLVCGGWSLRLKPDERESMASFHADRVEGAWRIGFVPLYRVDVDRAGIGFVPRVWRRCALGNGFVPQFVVVGAHANSVRAVREWIVQRMGSFLHGEKWRSLASFFDSGSAVSVRMASFHMFG